MDLLDRPFTRVNPDIIHISVKFGENVRIGNGVNIDKDCVIGDNVFIGHGVIIRQDCIIGDNVTFSHNCTIEAGCEIGDGVHVRELACITKDVWLGIGAFIGPGVMTVNTKNIAVGRSFPAKLEPQIFGNYCRIGAGSVIMPGVEIGRNAEIGAGSVVTKNVPGGETWFGNPARFRRMVRKAELC